VDRRTDPFRSCPIRDAICEACTPLVMAYHSIGGGLVVTMWSHRPIQYAVRPPVQCTRFTLYPLTAGYLTLPAPLPHAPDTSKPPKTKSRPPPAAKPAEYRGEGGGPVAAAERSAQAPPPARSSACTSLKLPAAATGSRCDPRLCPSLYTSLYLSLYQPAKSLSESLSEPRSESRSAPSEDKGVPLLSCPAKT
jgi:hypothetical protein